MFVRKLKNRNGSITVQIISKEDGRYRVKQTLGTSHDPDEVERLWRQAKSLLANDSCQAKLFSMHSESDHAIRNVISSLKNTNIRTIGPELIFGTLFDRMGFDAVPESLFRHLVIARLAYPCSKLKTVDYLLRYNGVELSVSALYAFLDRLHSRYKEQVEDLVYQHTCKRTGPVAIVFYDMTTLYFETEDEDDLRKIGFSKDGKFQQPQIMLGLLVSENGLPVGYDLFEGNTFEGHTLLPVLKRYQEKYGFQQPIVVTDAAMLSKTNLKALPPAQFSFILGARIKNEQECLKQEILNQSQGMKDGDRFSCQRPDGNMLIVSYSDKRARKDAKNREKGLARLATRLKTGKMTKEHLNNRGYNKFLVMEGNVRITIDEQKIQEDQRWDGLKGYLTNTNLSPAEVIETYSHLWQIEKAFRISKTDLRIRPIYHYRKRRIEAHLCIAFAAYSIYKELELLLKEKKIPMSAARAGELTHTMYELKYTLPDSKETHRQILGMNSSQQALFDAVMEI